ncbi:hypothetical protein AGABI2DRAFT_116537 [Agaricus bisporus var. bisporus H97]|uniref:hypothetical protein n=1 Tax=Agaricus bisporus var. bisporus (strain H97 / ATCC MYA-4626 / FGSC 10389) TaxID=936046 RepID=UPI00029F5CB9|nr:hypothetical protein AGABI2DRAFT_116537 [Agaricus bisporus var. bisporus H97]EKV49501.1 hypothetical protein AGABI2DRAFT_116537 [Agaricus bisporus var. bisporus H97]
MAAVTTSAAAPSVAYSYITEFHSGQKVEMTERERKRAKDALERAWNVNIWIVDYIRGGRDVEWLLMGRGHLSDSENLRYHWTVRAFFGSHAEMTFHLFGGKKGADLFLNGGKWRYGGRGKLKTAPW